MQVEWHKDPAISDVFYHPIDPAAFTVPRPVPTLTVSVGSIVAQCRAQNQCRYSAVQEATPLISSASISGLQVTIVGEGLLVEEQEAAGEGVIPAVSIGRVLCNVITRTDIGITCDLPHALRPGKSEVKVGTTTLVSSACASCPQRMIILSKRCTPGNTATAICIVPCCRYTYPTRGLQ